MVCDILDLRCIFVNELVGSEVLTLILAVVLFAIISSKAQFRFRTSMFLLTAVLLIGGLMISSFTTIFIVITITAVWFAGWVLNSKIFKN